MNCVTWNVRGVGNTNTQQQIWYLRNLLKLNIMAIIEPKVELNQFYYCTKFKMKKVMANCNNKIWVFHDGSYEIEVLEDKEQYLHCQITSLQLKTPILWTVVYAKCNGKERRILWNDMRRISTNQLPLRIEGTSMW